MAYATLQFSRAEYNNAGRNFASNVGDSADCLAIIDNFRASHAHPLNTFHTTLKYRAHKLAPKALVVQRIKRLDSIAAKLRAKDSMRLTQMQDIGGCRAVMPSVQLVRRLETIYLTSPLVHTLSNNKDYIAEPKATGYRGIHLMYTFAGASSPYAGLKIEIQIRTALQHKWATAVEAAETFTGQALKSNLGSEEWRRFFALMSSVFALREGCPTVPGTSDNFLVLCEEIRQLNASHHMATVFAAYRAILPRVEQQKNARYFLVRLEPENRKVFVRGYRKEESMQAHHAYTHAESLVPAGSSVRVVLVSVSSINSLKKAYPNYFLDTEQFLNEVQAITG
jgi:hypothetical protein